MITTRFYQSPRSGKPTWPVRLLVVAALFVGRCCVAQASDVGGVTGHCDTGTNSHEDVWVLSTRRLGNPQNRCGISGGVACYRMQHGCAVRASAAQFSDTLLPGQSICVFVHGNRMSARDVPEQVNGIRRRLNCAGLGCRLVFWSWPSDRVRGPFRDARTKASRADGESYYLASFLAGLPAETNVNLIGYSFGARALTGSLHLLAGGTLRGNRIGHADTPTVRPLVILFAAAVPNDWLRPNHEHGLALYQARRMISFYNPRDPALAHFDFVLRTGGDDALGYTGTLTRCLGPAAPVFEQVNVSGSIGKSHSLYRYLDSAGVMHRVRQLAFAVPAARQTIAVQPAGHAHAILPDTASAHSPAATR